jgi:transcriptional regulator with XRE-family HTH domain
VAVERARQGWSVEDVAEAAGVSPEIIRDAEGKHAAAVDSTLWRVLSAMDLKVARVDLVDGARQPFP